MFINHSRRKENRGGREEERETETLRNRQIMHTDSLFCPTVGPKGRGKKNSLFSPPKRKANLIFFPLTAWGGRRKKERFSSLS